MIIIPFWWVLKTCKTGTIKIIFWASVLTKNQSLFLAQRVTTLISRSPTTTQVTSVAKWRHSGEHVGGVLCNLIQHQSHSVSYYRNFTDPLYAPLIFPVPLDGLAYLGKLLYPRKVYPGMVSKVRTLPRIFFLIVFVVFKLFLYYNVHFVCIGWYKRSLCIHGKLSWLFGKIKIVTNDWIQQRNKKYRHRIIRYRIKKITDF